MSLILVSGVSRGQVTEEVPPAVLASAVEAVRALGNEVVMGKFSVAIERMNPLWKERTAGRMGGMVELEKQLEGVARQMLQQGISITAFQPHGQPRGFEVWPGKKVVVVDGKEVEQMIFTKWLVLVPTVTRFRIHPEGQIRPTMVESVGFQVVVADKGKDDWTFIDGSGVSVNELRGLFINLPKELELPPLEKREIR